MQMTAYTPKIIVAFSTSKFTRIYVYQVGKNVQGLYRLAGLDYVRM